MNGINHDGIDRLSRFHPDYFLLRENLGFDAASISQAIELFPLYEHTLIMHDDHWFDDENWLDEIRLFWNDSKTDIWGNVLFGKVLEDFPEYCKSLGREEYIKDNYLSYLHGMAGLFNRRGIETLKRVGIPFKNTPSKDDANLGERFFTSVLYNNDLYVSDFPSGKYNFFMHKGRNKTDSLFSYGTEYFFRKDFSKAKEYYYKYWEEIQKDGYYNDVIILFNNLIYVHYELKEYEQAKLFYNKIKETVPSYEIVDKFIAEKIL
jgi:tetratricopeptide (TPR) repeat protein